MSTQPYQSDIIAWANQQAGYLRTGEFSKLDIENLAEEIIDVGASYEREFQSRMTILLAHLLKWRYQPDYQGDKGSWLRTIIEQRRRLLRRLKKTPSLKHLLDDPDFWSETWFDAVDLAAHETKIDLTTFPEACIWTFEQITNPDFLPD